MISASACGLNFIRSSRSSALYCYATFYVYNADMQPVNFIQFGCMTWGQVVLARGLLAWFNDF